MSHTSENKVFMIEKYSVLGSPTLVQNAWIIKYQFWQAPSLSTISRIQLFLKIFHSLTHIQDQLIRIVYAYHYDMRRFSCISIRTRIWYPYIYIYIYIRVWYGIRVSYKIIKISKSFFFPLNKHICEPI